MACRRRAVRRRWRLGRRLPDHAQNPDPQHHRQYLPRSSSSPQTDRTAAISPALRPHPRPTERRSPWPTHRTGDQQHPHWRRTAADDRRARVHPPDAEPHADPAPVPQHRLDVPGPARAAVQHQLVRPDGDAVDVHVVLEDLVAEHQLRRARPLSYIAAFGDPSSRARASRSPSSLKRASPSARTLRRMA